MNKITRTSQAISNTYNSNFNADIKQWSEAVSIEEEGIGIRKCRIKINVEVANGEVKVSSGEVE